MSHAEVLPRCTLY